MNFVPQHQTYVMLNRHICRKSDIMQLIEFQLGMFKPVTPFNTLISGESYHSYPYSNQAGELAVGMPTPRFTCPIRYASLLNSKKLKVVKKTEISYNIIQFGLKMCKLALAKN